MRQVRNGTMLSRSSSWAAAGLDAAATRKSCPRRRGLAPLCAARPIPCSGEFFPCYGAKNSLFRKHQGIGTQVIRTAWQFSADPRGGSLKMLRNFKNDLGNSPFSGNTPRRQAAPPAPRERLQARLHVTSTRHIGRICFMVTCEADRATSADDACDPFALRPQLARRGGVVRRKARLRLPAVNEIAATDRRDFGRTCEMHDRLRPLLGATREQHGEAHRQAEDTAGTLTETVRHEARMEAVRRHAGTDQAARQFAGEQDVGELGAAV